MNKARGRCYLILFIIGATRLINEIDALTLPPRPPIFFYSNYRSNRTVATSPSTRWYEDNDTDSDLLEESHGLNYAEENNATFPRTSGNAAHDGTGSINSTFALTNSSNYLNVTDRTLEANYSRVDLEENDNVALPRSSGNAAHDGTGSTNLTFASTNSSNYLNLTDRTLDANYSRVDFEENDNATFSRSSGNAAHDGTGSTNSTFASTNSSNYLNVTNGTLVRSNLFDENVDSNDDNVTFPRPSGNAAHDETEDAVTIPYENVKNVYVINDTGIVSYVPSNTIPYSNSNYRHINITAWSPLIKVNNKHHRLPPKSNDDRDNSSVWHAVYIEKLTESPRPKCLPTSKLVRPPPVPEIEGMDATNFGSVTSINDTLNVALFTENGQPCITMNLEVTLMVFYNKLDYEPDGLRNAATFPRLPKDTNNVTVEGNCEHESQSFIRIGWEGHLLTWYFTRLVAERVWYVSRVDLLVYAEQDWFHKYGICGDHFEFSAPLKVLTTPLDDVYFASDGNHFELLYPDDLYDSVNNNIKTFVAIRKNFYLRPFFNL